jgi:inner membrane protein
MPSPIAHTLAGYVVYRVNSDKPVPHRDWRMILFYILCANLPDLDFLPGFLIGEPNRFHHGISHSLGFAVLFGILVGLFLHWRRNEGFLRNFLVFFSLYFSHLILDYLADDTSAPYGEPLWWPISNEYYISPVLIFTDIQRVSSGGRLSFITSLINLHNVWAVTLEFIVLLPILGLIELAKRKSLSSYSASKMQD